MTVLTTTEGQTGLPRYFTNVYAMARDMKAGRIDFVLPDGRRFRAEGPAPGPVAELRIHNHDLFARLVREGDLGFCEAYIEEWWSTPDLLAFIQLLHSDTGAMQDAFPGFRIIRAWERLRFWAQRNTRRQARRNIAAHYDLGNEFYALWLDDTMTYSSARFETGQESLELGQRKKYASMVEQMGARQGDHVLEIGCGWGGFAEYAAAEHGLSVTGVTISGAQRDYAVERIARAGLSDRVEIRLQDYRDVRGEYDGVASIEMFEAVGQQYWPVYFQALRERLRPGRNATLQIITVPDARWDIYRRGPDFVQKYIFPGGMLPSPGALANEIEAAGLTRVGSTAFGPSYAQTLRRWYDTFNERWAEIAPLGFDDRFRRMWNFYLASCAGAFDSGNCDVSQITLQRPA